MIAVNVGVAFVVPTEYIIYIIDSVYSIMTVVIALAAVYIVADAVIDIL